MKYEFKYLKIAHDNCSEHKKEILKSEFCGCFYCCEKFETKDIKEWILDEKDETAICPKCGIDSVVSEKYPISDINFLNEMNECWFS